MPNRRDSHGSLKVTWKLEKLMKKIVHSHDCDDRCWGSFNLVSEKLLPHKGKRGLDIKG